MLLAQLTEINTLCIRFRKLKCNCLLPNLNLIQILLQLTFNRPQAFSAITDTEVVNI